MVFIVALACSLGVDLWLRNGQEHGAFLWSNLPGFFAVFGFVACVVIVAISKLIGHYWLQRKEDYYERKDDDE
jgi:hypothetical protein